MQGSLGAEIIEEMIRASVEKHPLRRSTEGFAKLIVSEVYFSGPTLRD